jgi:hypothetical protein
MYIVIDDILLNSVGVSLTGISSVIYCCYEREMYGYLLNDMCLEYSLKQFKISYVRLNSGF